jgi:hypothetical protein
VTQFSDDEEILIPFLKQYRPIPPTVPNGFEDQLMNRIRLESQAKEPLSSFLWWGIPGAIVAGAVIIWGSSQTFQPTAHVPNTAEEIEAFLWENWGATTGQPAVTSAVSSTPLSNEWMTLAEPHTVFVGSRR